ncbi:hypothetical protein AJ78_01616 [Emergomyces pasteurianus Ep9510]|uniref:Uncharacterized protein n=1 Tax=Emergomyces pasteurianus Ep9510 TaxID=1447872 RepID=A0A1J9QR69_9EURO|nr:hypothetical protein AJ78_01616 [Emergomyces pasteurianus Ep9510]
MWAKGQAPKNKPVKQRNTRIIVSSFTDDTRLPTDCPSSGVLSSLYPKRQVDNGELTLKEHAKGTVRPVHIYSTSDKGEEYESFKIFDERPETVTDAEPGEQIE